MIKRDANQDGDRPHFYSQYWIDVSLGKPTGSSATAAVATESEEDFDLEDEALAPRPPVRPEPVAKPARPAKAPEKKAEPAKISSFADLANIDLLMKNSAQLDDDVAPDLASGYEIPADAPAFPMDVPIDVPVEADEEVGPAIESLEEAEELEYDDEEEEDDEWGNRRPGKKTKPTQPRRERRRDF